MIEGQERQAVHEVDELVRWIVPEDDPLPCIDEELGQRVMDLFGVHGQELRYQMHVTG
jgi:hypothetical protein